MISTAISTERHLLSGWSLSIPWVAATPCWFRANVTGNAGDSETDTVTVYGVDDEYVDDDDTD
jgi:hypothetical protein